MQKVIDHPRLVPLLILLVSLGILGSAYSSEVWGGIKPCILCYYQRYACGAAGAFGLAGVLFGGNPGARRLLVALAGLAFLTGAAIAAFHVGVEQHWWRGTAECHAPAIDMTLPIEQLREQLLATDFVPCDQVSWSLFGVSLAGYNLLLSLVLGSWSLWAASRIKTGQAA
ncbi:MAG: disulfide bond formation protein B [Rhodospirillales bacterium]|nr:disulfide bond formation protein B [Rhodospirillales bacterium]MDH3790941.1 disulfide bond formation protein B [Rhodospirillales bacterium]MDH3912400.1 disulfide bond formation protein B [Rhodospirillales bacterium]MDH3918989.1 disulfide bond formation protein B [Rhodospirillales bacterium]MDH3969764.1 disulfide bond formation protein B [Rhodospirillales bacterium]